MGKRAGSPGHHTSGKSIGLPKGICTGPGRARMRLRSSLGCPPAGPGSSQLIHGSRGAGSGLVHRVGELGEVCWGRTKHPTVQCKVEAGQGLGPSSSGSMLAGARAVSNAPPPAAETETPDPTERPPDDIHGIPGQLGPKPSDRQPSSSRLFFFHSPPGEPASAAYPKGSLGCTTSGHPSSAGAGTLSNSGCFSHSHSAVAVRHSYLGTLRA